MQYLSSLPGRTCRLKRSVVCCYFVSTLLLAGLLVITTPVATQAATPGPTVKLTARSLFQGHFKYGDWLPIEVNLENYGAATTVQVRVNVTSRVSSGEFTTSYQREINLGERANKRALLYITPYVETTNPSHTVKYDTAVTLWADGRQIGETKVDLQPNQPTDYIVGFITPDPNALLSLNNMKISGLRYSVMSLGLGLADIPDQAKGLRSFNTLVLGSVNTETLSDEQLSALRGWIESGGQLILLGGNNWPKVRSGFRQADLLPLEATGYTNITNLNGLVGPNGLPVQNPAPLANAVALEQAQVLKEARLLSYFTGSAGVTALAAEKPIGAGRVVATTLDFSQNPLLNWDTMPQIWQQLFGFNVTPYNQTYTDNLNPQIKNSNDFLTYITSVNDLKLPDIIPFVVLLLVYVVLVAPLSYLILKKLHRPGLAWLTIPTLGGCFSLVALNYTAAQPAGQLLVSQMTVIQSGPDQQTARLKSYAALFSPEERTYSVAADLPGDTNPAKTLFSPIIRLSSSDSDDSGQQVVQGEASRLDNLHVGQWSAQGFSLETELPAQNFQIAASLRYDGNNIVGTLRNSTASPLRDTMLAFGDQVIRFKDVIEAGETVPVNFELASPTDMAAAYCNVYPGTSSYINATPAEKISSVFQQDRRDDKTVTNRANFLRKIYESGHYSPLSSARGLDLIGWMDQNPVAINVNGAGVTTKGNQVLVSRLPVSIETKTGDGQVWLPAMILWPEEIAASTGQSPFTSRIDHTNQVCIAPHSSVTASYQLPVEQGAIKVRRLNLYFNSFTTGSGKRDSALPQTVELYNYQSQSWETLPNLNNSAVANPSGSSFNPSPTPVKNIIENAGRFADPLTGNLLMRLSAGDSGLFVLDGLEVEGNRS